MAGLLLLLGSVANSADREPDMFAKCSRTLRAQWREGDEFTARDRNWIS